MLKIDPSATGSCTYTILHLIAISCCAATTPNVLVTIAPLFFLSCFFDRDLDPLPYMLMTRPRPARQTTAAVLRAEETAWRVENLMFRLDISPEV
jgi:hypothetical protein